MTDFQKKSKSFGAGVLTAAAMAVALAAVSPVQAAAPAQPTGMPHAMSGASQQRAQFEQARMELMQAEQQLAQIQTKTLKAHPELKKQQQAFMVLMTKEMKRHGHEPKKDIAELRAMEGKLRSKSTSGADRQKLTQQFEQKLTAFQQARAEAMQSPKLKKARTDLSDAMLSAMKKEDPKTGDLLRKVTQKRQELMQMHRAAMGTGGMAAGKSPGK